MRTVRNSSPPEQAPPQSRHRPWEQTPSPRAGTPLGADLSGAGPTGAEPPGARTPPWSMHPPRADPHGSRHPPAARHAGIPPAMHAGIAPPPVNRITDTCKNITFATSLRTVIKTFKLKICANKPIKHYVGPLVKFSRTGMMLNGLSLIPSFLLFSYCCFISIVILGGRGGVTHKTIRNWKFFVRNRSHIFCT